MNNELMIFEGREIDVLTKEDVNFKFEGEFLMSGKQVTEILGYSDLNQAIRKHVDEDDKELITTEKLNVKTTLSLGQRGNWFITESGIYALIFGSKLEGAKKFKRWITKEVIPTIRNKGKFDIVENKIQQIQDEQERGLTLKLYQLENVLKLSPNDMLTAINYNQTKTELDTYKQQKQLDEVNSKLKVIENKTKEQEKKIENMFIIGDRTQFNNEIKSIARATGEKPNEIYTLTYIKLRDLYGIDLEARSKNAKEKIQEERINSGGKAYSPTTLNNKAGKLVIADELDLWRELGQSLNAVKNDLLNN